MEMIFSKLLGKAKKWGDYKDSLIFANISSEVNGEITPGVYEFFGSFAKAGKTNYDIEKAVQKQDRIKSAINSSFEAISNDECFSLFRFLKDEAIRYARIERREKSKYPNASDVFRYSISIDNDINKTPQYVVTAAKAKNEIFQSGQKDSSKKIYLDSILSYYRENYYKAICPPSETGFTVYYYLIRPSLDNQKLNGMLFFASGREVNTDALAEMARLLSDELIDILFERVREEATKSAKAAIMSRNMSHNIGSHVMSYLKQKLGSITAIMNEDNDVLYNLTDDKYLQELLKQKVIDNTKLVASSKSSLESSQTLSPKTVSTLPSKKTIQFPFLVGTGRFIGYLQERQDYIATIATDYIPYGAPVNLKDAIYDELNPDLRYMRHKSDDGNRPMNVLLSYIAKSEGLSRENMNNCKTENDQKVDAERYSTHNDILFGFPKYEKQGDVHIFGVNPNNCKSNDEALTEMRKINFSLPGGLVGRQAVFSIIENLIRNAAKHGNTRNTDHENLELILDVIDLGDLHNCIAIEDRICNPVWRTLYKSAKDCDSLYLLTITDNLIYPSKDKIFNQLKEALYDNYLDEKSKMKPTNKGIKEVRISAAWMRGVVDEECYLKYDDAFEHEKEGSVKKDKNGNNVLKEGLLDKKAPLVGIEFSKDNHLRYMICIPQDRMAAVVTMGMNDSDKILFNKLHAYSPKEWTIYNSISEVKENGKISFHYMFVANMEIYKELRPYTSNRLFLWQLTTSEQQEFSLICKKADESQEWYVEAKNAIIKHVYRITPNSEPIYIWDATAYKEFLKNNNVSNSKGKIICDEKDSEADKARYVYRTHHATEKEFYSYWEKRSESIKNGAGAYSQIVCIDAITGDNSSDRLVRREPLNVEWYCSHLYAMQKRIAVFDERLFKIVHNADENMFIVNYKANQGGVLSELISRLKNGEDFQRIKDEIESKHLLKDDTSEVLIRSKTPENLIKRLEKRLETFRSQKLNNYKSIIYKEKGVDVFTIIKEKDNTFAIIGFVEDCSNQGKLVNTIYDKVATITSTQAPFGINIEFNYSIFGNKYDYISIHQGLLDKLYEGFGIKEASIVNNSRKCQVTRCIHEMFMRKKYKPIKVKDGEDYLPCLIIHSGRAKPTKNDMPQEQPFVQYAAIEHGVQDCKYSLVELLDYARYD